MSSRVRGAELERRQHPAPQFRLPAVVLGHPGQSGPQQPVADAPLFQAVQVDGQRVGRIVLLEPDPHIQPLPQEALGRVGEQRDQVR